MNTDFPGLERILIRSYLRFICGYFSGNEDGETVSEAGREGARREVGGQY